MFMKSAAIRVCRYWFPVFFWCSLIFYFSSIPYLSTGWGLWDLILRKCAHFAEYGILAFLLIRAFKYTTNLSWNSVYAWSLRLTIFYALTDEVHQNFIPGRDMSLYDLLVDSFGALFATWFVTFRNIITNGHE